MDERNDWGSPCSFLIPNPSCSPHLSFLHIALQGSPFWKRPQEMYKAVRTAEL